MVERDIKGRMRVIIGESFCLWLSQDYESCDCVKMNAEAAPNDAPTMETDCYSCSLLAHSHLGRQKWIEMDKRGDIHGGDKKQQRPW